MAREEDLDTAVALPPGLALSAIRRSIEYIEHELVDLVEIYYEQINVFSAIVGIYGARALDQNSVYEKVRHLDLAQSRFPDLRHRRKGDDPPPQFCLESKASKRPWAIQSHYDHEGWYIVWRYLVDSAGSVEPRRPVVIWRVDVIYLRREDWKYEGSTAGESGGGRTHTFGVSNPAAKLRGCAAYRRRGIGLVGGKPVPVNGE